MIFRKICNDTSTMSATELAHNFVFVKNGEAWYRDFDREIPVRDLVREICAKHAAPADTDELTDEELDEILYDNLQFGTDDLEGVFALLYMALFGMADVRAWLERYETTGLPTTNRPEVLQECVNTYGAEAQVDMAVEEMSELTKALLKYRRKVAQGSKDLEAARENILEEVADVIIMLTQLIMIYGGRDLVQETIENKVDRQIKRLANTEGETGSEVAQEVLQPAT
jgi:NTP pyrophosphatase (non-canonical NTP hydrolase)